MDDTVKGKPQQIRTFSASIVTRQTLDHIIWDPFKRTLLYLHKLKGCFKILNGIHLYTEKLDPHDEAYGTLDYRGTLLFLPQLL